MAPHSSEGDSKEAMKTSEAVVSFSVGEKRKAETVNPEDSGEQEDGTENEGGAEYEQPDAEGLDAEELFKWGYDSFEDRKYHSSDVGEHSDEELVKQLRYYHKHLIQTKGFFESSEGFPKGRIGGISVCPLEHPAGKFGTSRELCTKVTSVCINKYNEEKKEKIELDSILRANFKAGPMATFYITFLAKEVDGSLVEYQAKAVLCLDGYDTIYPMLCRRPTKPEEEGTPQGEKTPPAST